MPSLAGLKVLRADGTLADPKRPVMVRDVMAHTSGLSYHFLEDTPVGRMYADSKLINPKVPLCEAIDDLAHTFHQYFLYPPRVRARAREETGESRGMPCLSLNTGACLGGIWGGETTQNRGFSGIPRHFVCQNA